MVNAIWTTYLQKEISKNKNLLFLIESGQIRIYLFGSAKYKISPNDLDILLTYNNKILSLVEVAIIKQEFKAFLDNLDREIPTDLLVLSYEEERQINFIKSELAINIY
jgi:hypothetical protein